RQDDAIRRVDAVEQRACFVPTPSGLVTDCLQPFALTHRRSEMDSSHRSPSRKSRFWLRKPNCGTERGQPKRVVSYAVPMVRIHLPPAVSPCLSGFRQLLGGQGLAAARAGLFAW